MLLHGKTIKPMLYFYLNRDAFELERLPKPRPMQGKMAALLQNPWSAPQPPSGTFARTEELDTSPAVNQAVPKGQDTNQQTNLD